MYVKPAPGLTIRDPDLKDYLPKEGRNVPDTSYWQRRIRDKDVILIKDAALVQTSAQSAVTDEDVTK